MTQPRVQRLLILPSIRMSRTSVVHMRGDSRAYGSRVVALQPWRQKPSGQLGSSQPRGHAAYVSHPMRQAELHPTVSKDSTGRCEARSREKTSHMDTTGHDRTRQDTTGHDNTRNTRQHTTRQYTTRTYRTRLHMARERTTQKHTTRHDTARHDPTRRDTTRHDCTHQCCTRLPECLPPKSSARVSVGERADNHQTTSRGTRHTPAAGCTRTRSCRCRRTTSLRSWRRS